MRSPENEGQRVSGHDESAHPPGAARGRRPDAPGATWRPHLRTVAWTCPEPPRKAEPLPLNAALKVRREHSWWWPRRESRSWAAGHTCALCSRATASYVPPSPRQWWWLLGPRGTWVWSPDPSRAGVGKHRYLQQQSKAAILGDEDRSGRDAAGEGKKEKG